MQPRSGRSPAWPSQDASKDIANDSANPFSFSSFFLFFSGTSLVPLLLRLRAPCSAQRPSMVGSRQGGPGSAFAFAFAFYIPTHFITYQMLTLPRRRPHTHTQHDPYGHGSFGGRAKLNCACKDPERVAVDRGCVNVMLLYGRAVGAYAYA
ncbi:hypothetical protein C8Q74DRAFT_18822 [Fomes fomentarius]|nr:hypothetical protein C8Q74DRAFT_18822 [Fomes fomentarius]